MKIKFYGTRGSIPVTNADYQEFGGNTTCIQITDSTTNEVAIIDAGTGIRNLGKDLIASGHEQFDELVIAFTHFHWDHIQGFPFFEPAYDHRRRITILAMGLGSNIRNLREIFETPLQIQYFPVQLNKMGADFHFIMPRGVREVFKDTVVKASKHKHPGGAYSYRFEQRGKVLVVCTDIEHGEGLDPRIVELAQGADLLIHDAQYTPEELSTRKGWGHSSYEQAIAVAEQAGVKQLIMTHHDPDHNDEFLLNMEKVCQSRFPNCMLARERMEIEL